jgi:hypothetical protein
VLAPAHADLRTLMCRHEDMKSPARAGRATVKQRSSGYLQLEQRAPRCAAAAMHALSDRNPRGGTPCYPAAKHKRVKHTSARIQPSTHLTGHSAATPSSSGAAQDNKTTLKWVQVAFHVA